VLEVIEAIKTRRSIRTFIVSMFARKCTTYVHLKRRYRQMLWMDHFKRRSQPGLLLAAARACSPRGFAVTEHPGSLAHASHP
jgi:hypothetical protein